LERRKRGREGGREGGGGGEMPFVVQRQ
jgi:hypothetical protein